MTTNTREVWTVAEVAQWLGVGRNLVYRQVRNGRIPALRIGSRILVPRIALERLIHELTMDSREIPRG